MGKKEDRHHSCRQEELVSFTVVNEHDAIWDRNHIKAADFKFDVGLIESQFKPEYLLGSGWRPS